MTNYDELVKRLRVWSLDERRGDGMLLVRTSDAIVQLQARVAELTDELQIECAARQTALAERDALAALLLEARRELHNDGTGYMQTLLARIDALAAERDTYAEDNRRHTEATNCMMDDLVTLRKRYERLSTASRQAYALAITEINIREAETVSLKADLAAARALLRECREDWIRLAYGASHEDVAAYRDFATRIDAALDRP